VNAMKEWMCAATKEEQIHLAALAKTSRAHLYHLSTGRRIASSELARELELASTELAVSSRGRLKALRREDLSPACGRCEYAKQCAAAETMAAALLPSLMREPFDPAKHAPELFGGAS